MRQCKLSATDFIKAPVGVFDHFLQWNAPGSQIPIENADQGGGMVNNRVLAGRAVRFAAPEQQSVENLAKEFYIPFKNILNPH